MIQCCRNPDELAQAAADLFAQLARQRIATGGRFTVALAGGETPRRTYQLLAREPWRSNIPWDRIHFFWGDERCVPADDPRSNQLMARTALLDHLELAPEQLHPIRGDLPATLAAEAYQAELQSFFGDKPPRFDLVLLGLGDDGHTASLLPGSAALNEQIRWTAVTRRPEEPFDRVTLTASLINQAGTILFLVAGAAKATVLQQLLETDEPTYPARLIRPVTGDLHWLVDREAAGMLQNVVREPGSG